MEIQHPHTLYPWRILIIAYSQIFFMSSNKCQFLSTPPLNLITLPSCKAPYTGLNHRVAPQTVYTAPPLDWHRKTADSGIEATLSVVTRLFQGVRNSSKYHETTPPPPQRLTLNVSSPRTWVWGNIVFLGLKRAVVNYAVSRVKASREYLLSDIQGLNCVFLPLPTE